ncbi:hypothetical protein Slin15195_G066830 [Septoria linicola]|uniref:Uncharacterized protein n=1 Tax=Septoria linicola TaxID=215465 RepID=A0A9Q9ARP9_9PEZI|nr:hypothetical protein Slin14017_G099540 [Septoria linicola]USW53364.1 hypothetical protein Slin15195_G066830 [Septoria linicola]
MAIPIIACGFGELVGGRTAPRLLPELEVIRFITSVQRAKIEIPLLLSGSQPDPGVDNVGTQNFSSPPKAVIFGRGFNSENVDDIRQACGGHASNVSWVHSMSHGSGAGQVKAPDSKDTTSLDAYAELTAAQVKAVLLDLKARGILGIEGVHVY